MDWSGVIFGLWVLKAIGEFVGAVLLVLVIGIVVFAAAFTHRLLDKWGYTKSAKHMDERVLRKIPQHGDPIDRFYVWFNTVNHTDPDSERLVNNAIKRLQRRGLIREEVIIKDGKSEIYLSRVVQGEQLQEAA